MAYISKRDARVNTIGPDNRKKDTNLKLSPDHLNDDYDDDLDGEDDMDEEDGAFRKSLNTEFPLSGGETDADA